MNRKALVVTVSDGVSGGTREDVSGQTLERMLLDAGFDVSRSVVPDEPDQISDTLARAVNDAHLVVTTGGTGFGPRDVTPEATLDVIEREAPGLAQAMIAAGLEKTPMAALSRLRVGSAGTTLIVNVPGSPKGAVESLEAILELIPHALKLLSGDTHHDSG